MIEGRDGGVVLLGWLAGLAGLAGWLAGWAGWLAGWAGWAGWLAGSKQHEICAFLRQF